jgi:hypothetical protein
MADLSDVSISAIGKECTTTFFFVGKMSLNSALASEMQDE